MYQNGRILKYQMTKLYKANRLFGNNFDMNMPNITNIINEGILDGKSEDFLFFFFK